MADPEYLYHRTHLENLSSIIDEGWLRPPEVGDGTVICFSEEYKSPKTTWGFVSFVFRFRGIKDFVQKTVYQDPGEGFHSWLLSRIPRIIYSQLKWEKEWYSHRPVPISLACRVVFFRRHPMGFVILHRKRLDGILCQEYSRLKKFEVVVDERP